MFAWLYPSFCVNTIKCKKRKCIFEELYQNDYSDRVDNSSDFMSQNAKKRKKTPSKGAKSKGYTALAKKYSDLNGFKPKVCREEENRCDCS